MTVTDTCNVAFLSGMKTEFVNIRPPPKKKTDHPSHGGNFVERPIKRV